MKCLLSDTGQQAVHDCEPQEKEGENVRPMTYDYPAFYPEAIPGQQHKEKRPKCSPADVPSWIDRDQRLGRPKEAKISRTKYQGEAMHRRSSYAAICMGSLGSSDVCNLCKCRVELQKTGQNNCWGKKNYWVTTDWRILRAYTGPIIIQVSTTQNRQTSDTRPSVEAPEWSLLSSGAKLALK